MISLPATSWADIKAGDDPNLRQQLGRLKASGLTMVLAEQNVRFVSELGDRV